MFRVTHASAHGKRAHLHSEEEDSSDSSDDEPQQQEDQEESKIVRRCEI